MRRVRFPGDLSCWRPRGHSTERRHQPQLRDGLGFWNGDNIGGFVGNLNSGSTISNSYATGSVFGIGDNIGGFVGFQTSDIDNSYAATRQVRFPGEKMLADSWDNNVAQASQTATRQVRFPGEMMLAASWERRDKLFRILELLATMKLLTVTTPPEGGTMVWGKNAPLRSCVVRRRLPRLVRWIPAR